MPGLRPTPAFWPPWALNRMLNRGEVVQAMVTPDEIKALIQQGLSDAQVVVQGDDGTHFAALVVSDEFEGKSTLARHRMVYATLGERMGREIHALSLKTLTREQAADQAV